MATAALLVATVALLTAVVDVSSKPAIVSSQDDVTDGSVAYPSQFPWHVAVLKTSAVIGPNFDAADLLGSGALISQNYVLTAASAVQGETNVSVLLGAISPFIKEVGTIVPSNAIQAHDKWNASTAENDLALINLELDVILSDTICLALLPPRYYRGATYVDQTLSISNWGSSDEDDHRAYLSVDNADVIRNKDCQSQQSDPDQWLPWTEMCVLNAGQEPRVREKGCPAVFLEDDGSYRLVGIVSSDILGTGGKKPVTLGRITEQLDWIASNSNAVVV